MINSLWCCKTCILLIILSGCKEDKPLPEIQYEYFVLNQGHFVIYDVQSIKHDITSDTANYQIKEVVGNQFIDEEGDTAFKLKRYIKPSDTSNWELKDVWWRKIKNTQAIQYEENTPYLKMIFPLKKDKSWNGNALNNKEEWTYQIKNINEPYSTTNLEEGSTLLVRQRSFESLVDFQNAYEIYAKDIGLVKKYSKNLVIENFDSTEIQSGTEKYMKYINHGQE